MAKMTKRDREQFESYLHNCTDAQVAGVRDREHAAGRRGYERLAYNEADRRGITLPPVQPWRAGDRE